jgi:hypothetical protein|tara:strand:- start:12840 stop:13079 length:240 start_codon:yes stop_codon:yes gene_type:complete
LTNESGTHLNSLAGRVAVKYRDVFHTTLAGAKIVPALRVVTVKVPLGVAYMDIGQGREQDAEALLVTYLEQLQKRRERF